jgi:MFS transporter, DHA2 family, multidrug resistance protein
MTAVSDDQPPPTVASWAGFIAMCIGMFMAILDIQIVATSLPAIQSALSIRPDEMSWLQTSYLIAEIIAIPLTGWLTRVLSLRGVFVVMATVFVIASAGCATCAGFGSLIAWRSVQGFAGGALIPIVFSAGILLFSGRRQQIATAIAGMLAVLAPTVGPIVGGWITSSWNWHWLFLINVVPGTVAILVGALCLPRSDLARSDQIRALKSLDAVSAGVLALALATFQIALKDAAKLGWASGMVVGLLAASAACAALFARRSLNAAHPIVDLRALADRNFALGCALSFILGIGLYGNVYLMPVFLAFVRQQQPFEIGQVMLVTGAAQLLAAPIVVWLERKIAARRLSLFGFALFAAGLSMSVTDTPRSDYNEMFWPQFARGVGIMFCLLPPTRIALGHLPLDRVPDASALFNLMRNLGGAIGLALIDTVIFGRAPGHGAALGLKLMDRDYAAFKFVGLARPPRSAVLTPDMQELARPAVERAALTVAVTEAWMLMAALTAAGVAVVFAVRAVRQRTTNPLSPLLKDSPKTGA